MSQLQNFADPAAVNAGNLPNQEENLVDLLENLTVFIAASSSLVQSLKQTIEVSKLHPYDSLEEEFICACPKICEQFYKKSSTPNVATDQSEAKPSEQICENNAVDPGTNVVEGSNEDDQRPKQPLSSQSNKTDASKKSDCICRTSSSAAAGKDVRGRTGRSPRKPSACEAFTKEKVEKLGKLRGDIAAAQLNLAHILEQVRQLERLYQDYESLNSPEGQVNTAALYKEIMKPQSVPYVGFPTSPPVAQCIQTVSTTACPSLSRGEMSPKSPQEKISILCAVPLDHVNYGA